MVNAIVAMQMANFGGAVYDSTAEAHAAGETHGPAWPKGGVPMPRHLRDIAVRTRVNGQFDLLGHMDEVIAAFVPQVESAHHTNAIAAPVYIPGDVHATPPSVFVFIKQFNIAMLHQVLASIKLRLFQKPQLVNIGGRLGLQSVGDVAKACGWSG